MRNAVKALDDASAGAKEKLRTDHGTRCGRDCGERDDAICHGEHCRSEAAVGRIDDALCASIRIY